VLLPVLAFADQLPQHGLVPAGHPVKVEHVEQVVTLVVVDDDQQPAVSITRAGQRPPVGLGIRPWWTAAWNFH
jgi:hypothetical protein